jgi:hypothetical protein
MASARYLVRRAADSFQSKLKIVPRRVSFPEFGPKPGSFSLDIPSGTAGSGGLYWPEA